MSDSEAKKKQPKRPKGKASYATSETYKGKKIVVGPADDSPAMAKKLELLQEVSKEGRFLVVEIDGRPIEILQQGPEAFHSVYVPYKAYSSPIELAKAIIDHVPSFRAVHQP